MTMGRPQVKWPCGHTEWWSNDTPLPTHCKICADQDQHHLTYRPAETEPDGVGKVRLSCGHFAPWPELDIRPGGDNSVKCPICDTGKPEDASPLRRTAKEVVEAAYRMASPSRLRAQVEAEGQDASPLGRQEGGGHYKDFKIQPVEFITANKLSFLEGCVIKRVCRHRAKNGAEDIRKAIHELELLLELEYLQKGA